MRSKCFEQRHTCKYNNNNSNAFWAKERGCVAISLHHYVDYKKRLKVKEKPNPEVGKAILFTFKRAWGSSSLITRDF
jgi:hypothetical protein